MYKYDEILTMFKKIHGNKYDYSLVDYKNKHTKVRIVCPKHGIFEQRPNMHIKGQSCPKCSNCKRLTTEQFIEKAKKTHGSKYDYSLVEYKNSNTKVKIICPTHDIFEQKPGKHIVGNGCPNCSKNKKLNTQDFIQRSKQIHGNKYDYSLVEYKNSNTKVKIVCNRCNKIFLQRPILHLRKQGCSFCNGNIKKNTKQFIEESKKVHGEDYDYSLVNYNGIHSKVKIICPKHGIFEQDAISHLKGHKCKKCSDKKRGIDHRINIKEFINRSCKKHNSELFSYDNVVMKNIQTPVKIFCKKHEHYFYQRPDNHFNGKNGCKFCNSCGISKSEKELFDFIKENYDGEVIENSRAIISPLEVDVYLPDLKLAFEFNDLYWHNELYVDKDYHLNKTKLCEEKGIHLIHIYEDDWLFKNDIVKSRILNLLGKTERKIYGRQCEIKYVSSKDSKEFLINNHIQGNVNSKVKLGLYYKEELVSLMTFGNLRKNLGSTSKENSYELLRFCNKINSNVIGGANKLYNYFLSNTNPLQILSYADRSWTSMTKESLYDKLGFKLVGETIPNYYYVKHNCRENRFNYRKDVLVKEGYDLNKTEREIMFDRGYNRIYDSGSLKYIWRNDE